MLLDGLAKCRLKIGWLRCRVGHSIADDQLHLSLIIEWTTKFLLDGFCQSQPALKEIKVLFADRQRRAGQDDSLFNVEQFVAQHRTNFNRARNQPSRFASSGSGFDPENGIVFGLRNPRVNRHGQHAAAF